MLMEFKNYLRDLGKSENTISSYTEKVRLYLEWCQDSFGSRPEKLYRENLLDYLSYMRTIKRYSPVSVNNHLSSLRCYNEYLISVGKGKI